MKVIVAGGRDFFNEKRMINELNGLIESDVLTEDLELVCGMALGADSVAKGIFEAAGLVVHERPADWEDFSPPCKWKVNKFGKDYNALAGMKRNHAMGDEADLLVAFWDCESKGTKDMIDYMRKLNKPVHVFYY